jgi:tetratricopeptide (TPR) repeat protein
MASQRMTDHLKAAMLAQDDPETVRAAAPAFLLLTESMIAESPDDPDLLMAGAELSNAYAALLLDPERRRRLSNRAFDYASRGLCVSEPTICETREGAFDDFTAAVDRIDTRDLDRLYIFAIAWAGWMETNSGDMTAVADLPKLEYVFDHILKAEPGFQAGRAQLYAGALASLRPKALGGNPEKARGHFEQALRYSDGRDLMVQVEFARRYARQVYDQTLHDRLLNEAIEADPQAPGLTLSNTVAQAEAEDLLAEEYFFEPDE